MKIFNTEDGIKKVYLQISDINMIDYYIKNDKRVHVPQKYYEQVKVENVVNDKRYVELAYHEVIEFIKSLSWIIDYDDVLESSIEKLIAKREKLKERYSKSKEKYETVTNPEKKDRILVGLKLLEYEISTINYAIDIKQGVCENNLPIVPKSKGFKVICGDYKMCDSLDCKKLLLFRVDGNPIHSTSDIPNGFIENAVPMIITSRKSNNEYTKYYESCRYLADFRKYLVFEYSEAKKEHDINKLKSYKRRVM